MTIKKHLRAFILTTLSLSLYSILRDDKFYLCAKYYLFFSFFNIIFYIVIG